MSVPFLALGGEAQKTHIDKKGTDVAEITLKESPKEATTAIQKQKNKTMEIFNFFDKKRQVIP